MRQSISLARDETRQLTPDVVNAQSALLDNLILYQSADSTIAFVTSASVVQGRRSGTTVIAGKRNADGQGFAAFGKVTSGMDIVRRIQASPAKGQTLDPPVRIVNITRTR